MSLAGAEPQGFTPTTLAPKNIPIFKAIILAVAVLLLARNLTGWLTGWHEWNTAWYMYFARNHIDYGLGYTKLFCTHGLTEAPPEPPVRYLDHPPLIALWTMIPMLVFGDHEWVGRGVAIASTLGSASLLMTIVGRLHSPALGLLTGFFYVTLPITAYFGRMLDHVPLVQFFSLLMLHGYLQWNGDYGEGFSRRAGGAWYAVGAALGTGTGWATIIMVGLIWIWHLVRVARGEPSGLRLLWLALFPGVAVVGVVLHILWGLGWDASMFEKLWSSRTVGLGLQGPQPWSGWFPKQWYFLKLNYTVLGVVAALAYFPLVAAVLHLTRGDSPFRTVVRSGRGLIPFLLMAVHGLIYVFMFKNQSWIHEYWQYFATPLFAVALATIAMLVYTALMARTLPRAATAVTVMMLLLPMPGFASSLDRYHKAQQTQPVYIKLYEELAELIPPKAPVFSWRTWAFEEKLGNYTHSYLWPNLAYHANRPIIYCRNQNDILANREGCAAYVLELNEEPGVREMADFLRQRYETVTLSGPHLVALLNKPKNLTPQS